MIAMDHKKGKVQSNHCYIQTEIANQIVSGPVLAPYILKALLCLPDIKHRHILISPPAKTKQLA